LAKYSVLVAGLVTAAVIVQPFTATQVVWLYTETINTALLTGSLLLFGNSYTRGEVPVAAAFLLGLAAVTRSELIPLAVALAGAYWLIMRLGQMMPLGDSSAQHRSLMLLLSMACVPLVCLLILQAVSTGEIGVVRYKPWNPGYYAWMRTWF